MTNLSLVTLATLTIDMIESLRQSASEVGDFDTTRACNAAMWGTNTGERTRGRRAVVRMINAGR